MEQTLRFLQEDREGKAERAANVAAGYTSAGSSSTRSRERYSQSGLSKESRLERDAEARADAEERKRRRVEVGVPADDDAWLQLVTSYSSGESLSQLFPVRPTGKELPPIPDDEEDHELPLRGAQSDNGIAYLSFPGEIDPLDARRISADLRPVDVDVDAVASALQAASLGKQTSAGREAIEEVIARRRSSSEAGDSRRASGSERSTRSPGGRDSPSEPTTDAKSTPRNVIQSRGSINHFSSNQDPDIPNIADPTRQPFLLSSKLRLEARLPESGAASVGTSSPSQWDLRRRSRERSTREDAKAQEKLAMGLGQPDAQFLDQGDLREEARRRSSSLRGSDGPPDADPASTVRQSAEASVLPPPLGPGAMAPGKHATPALVTEMHRVRTHFEKHGYLAAPQGSEERELRRLQTIRRLGLDAPDQEVHRETMDRFTRLASSIFKCKYAKIAIVSADRELIPAESGLDGLEILQKVEAFSPHMLHSRGPCMVVEDMRNDWRFCNNPQVKAGKFVFYAGAPLLYGTGKRATNLGSLCILDDKPHYEFDEHQRTVLRDLTECVIAEIESLHQEANQVAQQRMHQVTVEFLRRSLQVGPPETPRERRDRKKQAANSKGSNASGSRPGERLVKKMTTSQASSGENTNIYVDACKVIRSTLEASAVWIIDLGSFHVFFPSGSGGGTSQGLSHSTNVQTTAGSVSSQTYSTHPSNMSSGLHASARAAGQAMPLINTSPFDMRNPLVQFTPQRRRFGADNVFTTQTRKHGADMLGNVEILGSDSANGTINLDLNSDEARKVICDFIAMNLKSRRVWWERDDGEAVAAGIKRIMPEGTKTSLAVPIFLHNGQPAFCIAVSFEDELYSYDLSANPIAFVESISGTLLASSLKDRLHRLERAQMSFASLASHETRTPLHQMMATTSAIRSIVEGAASNGSQEGSDSSKQTGSAAYEEMDALCNTLEASGQSLTNILDSVLQFLEIGRSVDDKVAHMPDGSASTDASLMGDLLTTALEECIAQEKRHRLAIGHDLGKVECMLEIVPRKVGGWIVLQDSNALQRAVAKLVANALRATNVGYISIMIEDITQVQSVPAGYDGRIATSIVSITIEDTGCGMSKEFVDKLLVHPFTKADPFASGTGLGVTLASRTIELLGGVLTMSSEIGRGTISRIEVPLRLQTENDGSDDGQSEDEYDAFVPPRTVTHAVAVVGFDDDSRPGLVRSGKSLRKQIRARGVGITADLHHAKVIICEADCELADHCEDIVSNHAPELRVIILGATNDEAPSLECAQSIAVLTAAGIEIDYMRRPVTPLLVERLLMHPEERQRQIKERAMAKIAEGDDRPAPRSDVVLSPKQVAEAALADLSPSTGGQENRDTTKPSKSRDKDEKNNDVVKELRVLVVEDNPLNFKLLVSAVKKMGVSVFGAVDGVEGVERYIEHKPVLILLDIGLPRKSGFDVAKEIRAYEKRHDMARCTIVAVTALSAQDQQDRGLLESGIDVWSTKPISIRDLRLRIDRMKAEHRRAERGEAVTEGEERASGEEREGLAGRAGSSTAVGAAGRDSKGKADTERERVERVKEAEDERESANGGSQKGTGVRKNA